MKRVVSNRKLNGGMARYTENITIFFEISISFSSGKISAIIEYQFSQVFLRDSQLPLPRWHVHVASAFPLANHYRAVLAKQLNFYN